MKHEAGNLPAQGPVIRSAAVGKILGALLGWLLGAALARRSAARHGAAAAIPEPQLRPGYWGRLWRAIKQFFRAAADLVEAIFGY